MESMGNLDAAQGPPISPRREKVLEKHGDRRIDPYYWLREKDNPEVIAHLKTENAYTEAITAPTAALRERMYHEIVGRIQETDTSAPSYFKGYWQYTRTVEGLDYEIYCRRPESMDRAEQVLIDGNDLAKGHQYFELGFVESSPDQNLLAYAADYNGAELFEVRFRDLTTGNDLDDVLHDVYYGAAWAADNLTFFYVKSDAAMRPFQVWRHRLGTPPEQDVLVLQEDDERFELSVDPTKSERFIIFSSSSQVTAECRFVTADEPESEPTVIESRRQGIEYTVDDQEDRFLILTNDGARNFRLMAAPVSDPGRASWVEVMPERDGVRINFTDVHRGHVVLGQRSDGLQRLEVLDTGSGETHVVEQPDAAYTAFPGSNPVYDSEVMRFFYTSLTAPFSAVDYNMRTRHRTLVKEQPVRGGYDRNDYVTERVWATAPDGVQVPISLVHRRDLEPNGGNPTLLNGYGAYEASSDPMFDPARLSMLDRGFVFAIAHVRGGGEMGRGWYEDGKFLNKTNTFTDFIACASHLIDQGYTSASKLAIRGRSAGGLLIGAVLNSRPDLFSCAVAQVPFVDVVTTMLDETVPLTVTEYEEWGNPNDVEYYEYMKSYSPYDNIRAAVYPAMLVTAGLNDPRVSYWEPAKWVAKLREANQGRRPVLLQTEMSAGHSGPSGRYESWREEAFITAFVLSQLDSTAT
jgi:oligopeptidase B